MQNFTLILVSLLFFSCSGCSSKDPHNGPDDGRDDITITSQTVVPSFVGIGPQWGGYDNIKAWTGNASLSNDDWNKLYTRLRYMKPPLMRIMVSPGWNYDYPPGNNFEKSDHLLIKMLDFCQTEGIDVIFGEWGHQGGSGGIDDAWVETAANFYDYLVRTKGYTCIKYYNMVNEPNGDWSSINGNYNLWEQLIKKFHAKLVEKDLANTCQIIGPDVAIWNTNLVSWVSNVRNNIGNIVTAYDIHTYPSENSVRSGEYTNTIKAYRNAAPASAIMIMAELGFKYETNSELDVENKKRINADNYASDDSNMMVYEAFYGTDMADVVIQNMLAGYAGVILWDLDDAQYSVVNMWRLKRWGFWNIQGAETFGNPDDENIRPWFYTMSLLSRYFPKGTEIKSVNLPNKRGVRAVAGIKNGKYTIAIVNSNVATYNVNLKMENGVELNNLKKFVYIAGEGAAFTGKLDSSGFAAPESENLSLDLSGSIKIELPPRSFFLYTNM
ncbi:MAG: hypothetical protein FWH23_06125 [Bacteroidales bacterium]|nr:hypothetical protein [Bacteroidales bacterium]